MSSTVDKIKERLNIVEVVGNYLKLERAGINYKARCPFHNEKTPSFFVSPARENYHCFGCNKGGDIFSFVQEIEGVDFLGALKILAERAGVEVESFASGQDDKTKRWYSLLAAASEFYQGQLGKNKPAGEYLAGRGVKPETITQFALGYAPADWREATEFLTSRGYKEEELEAVGLAMPSKAGGGAKGSRHYDRFRGRIMFPLADSAGRVVGFSGRLFPETGKTEDAKYINTPQTVLYNKSRLLYGLDKAKVAIRRAEMTVLVEGQMDLIMSHQAGVENAVAVSGTALTAEHLLALKRLAPQVVMAFDQDLAGINAARRAIDLALGLGLEVRAALITSGKDPADMIKLDPLAWEKAVAETKHVIDFYLSVLAEQNYDNRALRLAVSKEVLPYLARLENAIDQAHFVSKVATFLNLPEEPIWQEVRKIKPGAITTEVIGSTSTEVFSRKQIILERLQAFKLWAEGNGKYNDLLDQVAKVITFEPAEEDKSKLNLEGEMLYAGKEKLAEEITELLTEYRRESLREELASLLVKVRAAEASGDHANLDKYLKKCQAISEELHQFDTTN